MSMDKSEVEKREGTGEIDVILRCIFYLFYLCVFVTEWDVHAAVGGHVRSLLLFGHHCYL